MRMKSFVELFVTAAKKWNKEKIIKCETNGTRKENLLIKFSFHAERFGMKTFKFNVNFAVTDV